MGPARTRIWLAGLILAVSGSLLCVIDGALGWLVAAAAGSLASIVASFLPALTSRRQADALHEAQQHLTASDRAWLTQHGWDGQR